MKPSLLLLSSFLFIYLAANAQRSINEFGNYKLEELTMESYEADKTADAVVLADIGISYFVNNGSGFDVMHERFTRIRVFNDAGVKYANLEIPFYQEGSIYEKIIELGGWSYNIVDGRIVKTKLNIANCFDEKLNEYWKVKKVAMPNVKEGTVFEIKYKIQSPYKFNLRDWNFQYRIPVAYSEYEARMIPFYEYSFILQGAQKFDTQKSYVDTGSPRQFGSIKFNDYIHKYIMRNVPAFKDEEFITSINDYILKIDFQLSKIIQPNGGKKSIMTTWPEIIKELNNHPEFGKFVSRCEKLAPKILNMNELAGKTDREKFDYVVSFVKSNYNWNKSYSKYSSKKPETLVKDKFGTAADINLLTTGLLRAVGINANPVLISTRNNGSVKPNYPFLHFFNYVVIVSNIDGDNLLSDATENMLPNDQIPIRCINDIGLLVAPGEVKWVGLGFNKPSELQRNITFNFIDEKVSVNIEKNATEYEAYILRNNLGNKKEEIAKTLNGDGFEVIESSIQVKNYLETDKPYIINYALEGRAEIINDKIYIDPFLKSVISENPMKYNSRTYPIDMVYPEKNVFTVEINIPEGYKAEYIPVKTKSNTNLFEMDYDATVQDNKVIVNFSYAFKKAIYPATDYMRLKAFFNDIVRKGHDKIVLSKI